MMHSDDNERAFRPRTDRFEVGDGLFKNFESAVQPMPRGKAMREAHGEVSHSQCGNPEFIAMALTPPTWGSPSTLRKDILRLSCRSITLITFAMS